MFILSLSTLSLSLEMGLSVNLGLTGVFFCFIALGKSGYQQASATLFSLAFPAPVLGLLHT